MIRVEISLELKKQKLRIRLMRGDEFERNLFTLGLDYLPICFKHKACHACSQIPRQTTKHPIYNIKF